MDRRVSKRSFEELQTSVPAERDLVQRTLQVSISTASGIHAIDPDCLVAGDVVLFKGSRKVNHRAIRVFQRRVSKAGSFHAEAVEWVHVGILDANLNVWDATGSGDIGQTPLRQVLARGEVIAVRRFPKLRDIPSFERRLEAKLLRFSEARYDLVHFVGPLIDLLFPGLGVLGESIESIRAMVPARHRHLVGMAEGEYRSVICSVFVSEVLAAVSGYSIRPDLLMPLPMHFTMSPFQPVSIARCRPILRSLGDRVALVTA